MLNIATNLSWRHIRNDVRQHRSQCVLSHHQILVAMPNDANDVRLEDDGETKRNQQDTCQRIWRQCEQLIPEWQTR